MTERYTISHTRTKYTNNSTNAELNTTKYYTDFMHSISINYISIKQLELFVILNCSVALYGEICDNGTKN